MARLTTRAADPAELGLQLAPHSLWVVSGGDLEGHEPAGQLTQTVRLAGVHILARFDVSPGLRRSGA